MRSASIAPIVANPAPTAGGNNTAFVRTEIFFLLIVVTLIREDDIFAPDCWFKVDVVSRRDEDVDVFIARDGARAVNDALMCLSKTFFFVVAVDVLWVVGKRIEEYIACLS
jgi:hypothetical protein